GHRWADDRLLHGSLGVGDGLGKCVRRVGLVVERPAGQARQLPMMAVGEDREVLSATGQVWREASPGQGVGDGVRRKAGPALFAVRNDWRAGRLEVCDGVADCLVLPNFEFVGRDASSGIVGIAGLELAWAWK